MCFCFHAGRHSSTCFSIAAILFLAFTSAATADTLTLRDGTQIPGTYLGGTAREIRFSVGQAVQRYDVVNVVGISFQGEQASASDANPEPTGPAIKSSKAQPSPSTSSKQSVGRIFGTVISSLPHLSQPNAKSLPQQIASEAIGKALDNELPLKLDAQTVYRFTPVLPGGPFQPRRLVLTTEILLNPLPPGDYSIPVIAMCTQYSEHRPGQGIRYDIGPAQGKHAEAIITLLWRGMFDGQPQGHLQGVAWTIQSGTPYGLMPVSFQKTIDRLIPDFKKQLGGNFIQKIDGTYQTYARLNPRFPTFAALLGALGKPGQLALTAKQQQDILLQQNMDDRLKEQTLWAGQNHAIYTPERAEEIPWTVAIPNAAYMRFKVVEGNLGTNTLELRVLRPQNASLPNGGYLLSTAQAGPAITQNVRLLSLLGVTLSLHRAEQLVTVFALAPPPIKFLLAATLAGGVIAYPHAPAQALIIVLSLTAEQRDALTTAAAAITKAIEQEDRCKTDFSLPSSAYVVRAGMGTEDRYENGSGVWLSLEGKTLQGVSVNSFPGLKIVDLVRTFPSYGKVSWATVGKVRAAGGNVYPDPTPPNPYHAILCGITAKQAVQLLTVIDNPARVR